MQRCDETAIIDATPNEVFALLADPSRLGVWAVEFCQELEADGEPGDIRVRTPMGWVFMQIEGRREADLVELRWGLARERRDETMRIRVNPTPDGRTHLHVLYIPLEPIPAEAHDAQSASLRRELAHLAGLFAGAGTH